MAKALNLHSCTGFYIINSNTSYISRYISTDSYTYISRDISTGFYK